MGSGNDPTASGDARIRELARRVDALRRSRRSAPGPALGFRWESGPDGLILWVAGAPRSALIGQTIASASAQGPFGADDEIAAAFARRAPFRDNRFLVAGSGPASGEWLLSGVPFFDPRSEAFLGYRGSARRPFADRPEPRSTPAPGDPGLFGTELSPDALRQLIHELRTPLNAILGFAEMIEGQYLGPAGDRYRARATRIREQAGLLLAAVDDLDTAASSDRPAGLEAGQSAVDLVALLYRLHQAHDRVAAHGIAALDMAFEADLPLARVAPEAAERMVSRLLAATIGLAEEGEILGAAIALGDAPGAAMLALSLGRPRSVRGLDEAQLLDPGYMPPGYWPAAPSLGLGFTLRLVRSLAESAGGSLAIESDRFVLRLPALAPDAAEPDAAESCKAGDPSAIGDEPARGL